MIINLSFKTPDVMDQINTQELTIEEIEEAQNYLQTWLKFSEYIDVEFDTEKDTATVKRKQR